MRGFSSCFLSGVFVMARPNSIHPHTLPKEYYEAIGDIIVGWNLTELYLQTLIWLFLGITNPKQGRLLTYDLGAEKKIELLKAATDHWTDQTTRLQVRELCIEADRLRVT